MILLSVNQFLCLILSCTAQCTTEAASGRHVTAAVRAGLARRYGINLRRELQRRRAAQDKVRTGLDLLPARIVLRAQLVESPSREYQSASARLCSHVRNPFSICASEPCRPALYFNKEKCLMQATVIAADDGDVLQAGFEAAVNAGKPRKARKRRKTKGKMWTADTSHAEGSERHLQVINRISLRLPMALKRRRFHTAVVPVLICLLLHEQSPKGRDHQHASIKCQAKVHARCRDEPRCI